MTITERENIHSPLARFFERFVISYYGVMDVYLIAAGDKAGRPSQTPQHLSVKIDDPSLSARSDRHQILPSTSSKNN
ncbi:MULTISPECIES: hypothetical protein [Methylocaldum]|uniref:hypothetical protein n=2 Tax=unclassified Methylocaldum TaxID=2622260 RepID=UPI00111BD192|nr:MULTISPECIES: hypothetical protein [unclassified Methylocaldum]MBP1149556.1 hypothetical protein [Methylocaldum sp. RMAD-M]MVF20936.1 hypothetical protein [Methylocaldum sp. BRCS4]